MQRAGGPTGMFEMGAVETKAGVGEIEVGTGKVRVGAVEVGACTVDVGTVAIGAGATMVDVGAVAIWVVLSCVSRAWVWAVHCQCCCCYSLRCCRLCRCCLLRCCRCCLHCLHHSTWAHSLLHQMLGPRWSKPGARIPYGAACLTSKGGEAERRPWALVLGAQEGQWSCLPL